MYSIESLRLTNIISYKDSFYKFKKGKAIIIVGENKDNPKQKGNGSGKSGFIEGLSLGFTGDSIRKVLLKELINRDSKDGEVEMVLKNSITKKRLIVWRKFYIGSKSAECKVWLVDKDEKRTEDNRIKRSKVTEYSDYIFEEIGISKEDFFNFFLLVQSNYSAFLPATDLKKKEIINRFSGADSIDDLLPLVKIEAETYDPQIKKAEGDIQLEEGKLTIHDERIVEIQVKKETWSAEKEKKVEDLNEKIIDLDDAIITLEAANKEKEGKIRDIDSIIEAANYVLSIREKKSQKLNLETDKKTLDEKVRTLTTSISFVKNEQIFKDRIQAIQTEESNTQKEIDENIALINSKNKKKSDIEKSLMDVIECPKCTHHFSFKDVTLDIQEANRSVNKLKKEVEDLIIKNVNLKKKIDVELAESKRKVNEDVLKKQNEIREDISKVNIEIVEKDIKITAIGGDIAKLEQQQKIKEQERKILSEAIKANKATIDSYNLNIDQYLKNIDELEATDLDSEIKKEEQAKIAINARIVGLKSELDRLNKERGEVAQWETNFKNFKSFVANQSIKNIEDYTNLFLQQMGTDLSIKMDGFSTLASGKLKEQIATTVLRGGFELGSYGSFSGGERGRIDICVILAIQQLINLNCKSGGLDLLICDEVLDQIDTLGLESIINSLQNLNRTILIVSQNEINALKDYTLLIRKQNKISTFVENF